MQLRFSIATDPEYFVGLAYAAENGGLQPRGLNNESIVHRKSD